MDLQQSRDTGKGKKVVVLGGGFAGLRIAYLLRSLGYTIALVEKSDSLGGMVQTFTHECGGRKYRFDYGPHIFFGDHISQYRAILADGLTSLSGRFQMYTRGSVLSYPLRPAEILIKMNPLISTMYVGDFLLQRLRGQDKEDPGRESVARFMSQRFGQKLFNSFYAPYIEKCCGLAPDQIAVEWARERENVSGKTLMENIRKKIMATLSSEVRERLAASNDPSAPGLVGWYPRYGAGQMCDAMYESLSNQSIFFKSSPRHITVQDHRVRDVVIETDGSLKTISGDYYVSTIPLPELFALFRPGSTELIERAKELTYRRVRLVNLIIRKKKIMESFEMFSMERHHIFKRVYEPKAMSEAMAPTQMSSLCLEVCFSPGDAVAAMTENDMVKRCIEGLIDMGLLTSADEVKDSFTVEMPHAYPVYRLDFEVHRRRLLDFIADLDNFLTCGRQGLFRYHAMTNEIMDMADEVVDFLAGFRKKCKSGIPGSKWGQSFY